MAIDSAEKRKMVVGIALQALGPGITINSSKDIDWRFQAANNYYVSASGGGGGGSVYCACPGLSIHIGLGL